MNDQYSSSYRNQSIDLLFVTGFYIMENIGRYWIKIIFFDDKLF